MTATMDPERAATIPTVDPVRAIKLPLVSDQTLRTGLRVLAARKPGVPRVEARLIIPIARGGDAGKAAAFAVLAKTLLSGTSRRSALEIAESLQAIGGGLDAFADEDDVVLTGSALAPALPELLDLLADVVTDATHPDDEVALERTRLAQEITLARSQPETIAGEALLLRLFGRHPYGRGIPDPAAVGKVRAPALRTTQAERLLPKGSVLVIVGDIRPDRAIAAVEDAFGTWKGRAPTTPLAPPPPLKQHPILLVPRAGAVQTNLRFGGAAVNRSHPDWPALALANLVFGGYFISRLVDNIRERRGYTYSPGSAVRHLRSASYFTVQADVGTEVTAPAIAEILYELDRMVAGPIDDAELDAAKRYLGGSLSMSMQTQAGLAAYLAMLATNGLPLEYLRDYPKRVAALSADDVIAVSRKYLAAHRLVLVAVGDGDAIAPALEGFGALETGAV
jgi:zinc protease